jgi:uncharacterized membrane protein
MTESPKRDSVEIEQSIDAPAERVADYIGDFRNAKEWMVGVEGVERLAEDSYRLRLESPIGKLEPEVRVLEHGNGTIRWSYISTVEGSGEVVVTGTEDGSSCVVSYGSDFHLKGKILNRAARFAGMERFARRNSEQSLLRLKQLMEARRY